MIGEAADKETIYFMMLKETVDKETVDFILLRATVDKATIYFIMLREPAIQPIQDFRDRCVPCFQLFLFCFHVFLDIEFGECFKDRDADYRKLM